MNLEEEIIKLIDNSPIGIYPSRLKDSTEIIPALRFILAGYETTLESLKLENRINTDLELENGVLKDRINYLEELDYPEETW